MHHWKPVILSWFLTPQYQIFDHFHDIHIRAHAIAIHHPKFYVSLAIFSEATRKVVPSYSLIECLGDFAIFVHNSSLFWLTKVYDFRFLRIWFRGIIFFILIFLSLLLIFFFFFFTIIYAVGYIIWCFCYVIIL